MEVMGLFLALAILLLFVTVVGHGIWVTLASLFSGGASATETGKLCPRCGSRFGVRDGRCMNCGAVPHVPPGTASPREELTSTARQLWRFRESGLITQQQY